MSYYIDNLYSPNELGACIPPSGYNDSLPSGVFNILPSGIDTPHNCELYVVSTASEVLKGGEFPDGDISNSISSISPLTHYTDVCGKCPTYDSILEYTNNNPTKTIVDAVFDVSNQDLLNGSSFIVSLDRPTTTNTFEYPRTYYNKNILVLYNVAAGTFEERVVINSPSLNYHELSPASDVVDGEYYFVKWIENTAIPLSVSDPKMYKNLLEQFQSTFGYVGTCCYLAQDNKGYVYNKCILSPKQQCTTSRLQEILNEDPYSGKNSETDNILSVILDAVWTEGLQDCAATNCGAKFTKLYGTCCYIPASGNFPDPENSNDWSCVVNTKENCRDLDGFWESAEEDGLGGYNTPNCSNRGTKIVNIVDGINTTIALGPRNCGDNQIFVDNKKLGSCCHFKNSDSIVNNERHFSYSVISTGKSFAYTGKLKVDDSGIDRDIGTQVFTIALFALNNGSTVVLSFPVEDLIDKIYIYNQDANTLAQRIENDFSVFQNNFISNEWKLKFSKIEKNNIVLTSTQIV